jgi:hypothetical protein
MSRLDSFIRRLTAQRDILNSIVDLVGKTEGPVLEFGLGNGRTYDHLREHFPDRRIIAFDRDVRSYSSSTPPAENMVTGRSANPARPSSASARRSRMPISAPATTTSMQSR